MSESILATLSHDAPPADLAPPMQALWWLKKGELRCGPDWERAHAICQSREGERSHDLVHALVHLIEGDASNASYWYRRAGVRQVAADADQEWTRIAALLTE